MHTYIHNMYITNTNLPDHGIHRSITNCKASQASPYLHVKQPAFYISL